MRKVTIYIPGFEPLVYTKGVDDCIGIYDESNVAFPVVRVIFDDNSFKIYRGFPYELVLPPKLGGTRPNDDRDQRL